MSFVCCSFLCSPLRLILMSVVFDFNASLNDVTPASPILLSIDLKRTKKKRVVFLMDVICVLLPLCSQLRTSFVSAVFDFSASPNDAAPLSLMLLPVDSMRMEKSGLVGAICVLFLLSLHHRLSFVSVVFDFNASLNDVAPASPISFTVC